VRHADRDEPSSTEIRIDLLGLREFAEAIRGEVDGSVRPQAHVVQQVYAEGVCFGGGWWPSSDVRQARDRYSTCLAGIDDLLNAHVLAAERMVLAAESVLRAYRSTDALAAASADDVDRAFGRAHDRQTAPAGALTAGPLTAGPLTAGGGPLAGQAVAPDPASLAEDGRGYRR
jgi:hypothetical protein